MTQRRQPRRSDDQGYWFVRKRYGYGATPSTWQGWVSIALYIAVMALIASRLPASDTMRFLALFPITAAYLWFVYTKTDGGFGWHWGNKD